MQASKSDERAPEYDTFTCNNCGAVVTSAPCGTNLIETMKNRRPPPNAWVDRAHRAIADLFSHRGGR